VAKGGAAAEGREEKGEGVKTPGEEAGERRVWGWRIHRYVFQPQSYRSRREVKRIRGKKRTAEWGKGRKRGKGCEGKKEREKREIEEQRQRGRADDGSGGGDDSSSKC